MPSADGHEEGPAFHQLHRLAAPGLWRTFVGAVALVGVVMVLAPGVVLGLAGVVLRAAGHSSAQAEAELSGDPLTPAYLLTVNLAWALAIPVTMLLTRLVQEMSPRWLLSVVARFRWRWFAACLGLALVTLVVTAWVSAVLPSQGSATVDVSGHLEPWTSQVRDYLLIIVLLTPLQAAGEEFTFRGYLTQLVGSVGRRLDERVRAAVVVVVPAFLFGLAHGSQGAPIFFDRFAFGIVAGVLVLVTGGIEAGIAMHVLNNFLAFGLALAFGDMNTAMHPGAGSWWAIPVTLVQSLLYLALCWALSRRRGLERRSGPAILEARAAPL